MNKKSTKKSAAKSIVKRIVKRAVKTTAKPATKSSVQLPYENDKRLAAAAERIATALENMLQNAAPAAADSEPPAAARWHFDDKGGCLLPLSLAQFDLSLLRGLEQQLKRVDSNMRAFLRGKPANHMLLTGPRGSGKSSLLRGIFARYRKQGLRVIETDVNGLSQLPRLLPLLHGHRYVVYCDDLSFGRGGDLPLFQRLKSALEGTLGGGATADNVLVCATSNRRRLAAEFFDDNASVFGGEIQGGESIDETLSLSDRFGLWVPFFELDDAAYLNMARHWLTHFNIRVTDARLMQARRWAEERGGRNGRTAHHFAIAAANGTAD